MNKYSKILFSFIAVLIFTNNVYATTIKETTVTNDTYDTIERNTTIIGVTKFTANEVITASKATTAGANDATLYMKKNGTIEGYSSPTIYIYYGPVGGWYSLDENNKATYIEDKNLISKLSNLDIYYVNNKEKVIGVEYKGDEIDTTKLPKGVSYSNNTLLVNSTLSSFEIITKDNNKISYSFNNTINTFEVDNSTCFTIKDGYITDYDSTCSKKVVIPSKIKNEKIIGIKEYSFYDKGITDVVIPETIMNIESNAFSGNNLKSVTIDEKYDDLDFDTLGVNAFGTFTNITYNNQLTRAAKLIPETLEIKAAKDITICASSSDNESISLDCQYEEFAHEILVSYVQVKIAQIIKENGYNDLYTTIEMEEDEETGNITYILNLFDSYIAAESHEYQKEVNFIANEFDISEEEKENTRKIITEIESTKDPYFSDTLNINQLEAISDKYNFEVNDYRLSWEDFGYNYTHIFSYPSDNDPTITSFLSFYGSIIGVEKDGKLYGIFVGKSVIAGTHQYDESLGYEYRPTLSYKGYNDIDAYINDAIKLFEEKIGITNYKIIPSDNKNYQVIENDYEERIKYIVKIIDLDTNLPWTIILNDYYENKYDESGFTELSCFEIYGNSIVGYDDKCGENVVIPEETKEGTKITSISEAFNGAIIKSVKLPESLKEIGSNAFASTLIEEITIPNSVEFIGAYAFMDNYHLSKVTLSNTLKEIDSGAFANSNIKTIELPNTLEKIYSYAFANTKLENIIIPNSVKKLSNVVFTNTKIKEVTIPSSVEEIEPDTFDEDVKINFEDKLLEVMHKVPHYLDANIGEHLELKEGINFDYDLEGEYLITYASAYLANFLDIDHNSNNFIYHTGVRHCEEDYCIEIAYKDNYSNYYSDWDVIVSNDERTLTKEVTIYYESSEIKENTLNEINKILEDGELKDEYYYKYFNKEQTEPEALTTTDIKIKEIEEKYNINIIYRIDAMGGGGSYEDEGVYIDSLGRSGYFYILKNDILYAITNRYSIVGDIFTYYSALNPNEYSDINKYIEDILTAFSKYTEIDNYEVKTLDNNLKYKIYEPTEDYQGYGEMYLTDLDNNREWYIYFDIKTNE